MVNNSLTQEINLLHARICSAISEPNRILLLYAVADKPLNVNNLAEIVGISQSAASRHLKVLRERGLIQAQRDGTQVIYSLADDRFIQALDLLREVMLDQLSQQADLIKQNQSNER
jgi:DNA-binding transcriptional ArsR family regulator